MSAIKSKDGLPDETVKTGLIRIEQMLRTPGVEVHIMNSIRETTQPGDTWRTYTPGKGQKISVEIPCEEGEFYEFMDKDGYRRRENR